MTLDEIEALARYQLSGEASADNELKLLLRADKLARFVVEVLPVVRAAVAVSDTWDGPVAIRAGVTHHEEVERAREMLSAIDAMRTALKDSP